MPGDTPSQKARAAIEASLKACAHCGPMPAMPELVRCDTSGRWQVFCGPCGSSSGSSAHPEQAAASWNSRAEAGPSLPTSSSALTSLALLLGNRLASLEPSTAKPVYGFASPDRQAQAYALALEITNLTNWQIERIAITTKI